MNHHILLQEIIQLAQAQTLSVELFPITFHSVIWCIHLLYLIFEGAYIQMNWSNDIYIKGYLYQKRKVTLTRKIWNTLVEIDTYNTCTYGWYLYLCHNESYISFTKNCRTCSLDLIALMVWPCLGQIISLLSLLSLLIALNGLALHRFECNRENCFLLLLCEKGDWLPLIQAIFFPRIIHCPFLWKLYSLLFMRALCKMACYLWHYLCWLLG